MVKAAMRLSASKKTILTAIIGLLIILSLNFFQKEVKGFFYSLSEPILKAFWRAGSNASDFSESIFNAKNLKKDNEELNLKIQELFFLQNSIDELEKENETLREALGLGLEKDFRLELAEVIGKDAGEDAVLINKGSENGISKGMLVITAQKVLIGVVAEVYKSNSRVSLISDTESQLQVEISGSKISGLLKGLGSSRLLLDLIPMEEKIKEGDLIVWRDFLAGLIKEVKKTDASPFQQAEVSPFFKISDLDKVLIILGS